MATKAQQFRYEAERSSPKKPARPAPRSGRRSVADDGAQNLKKKSAKNAPVATEESLSGKRSRKSTRPSNHHGKNSVMLEYAARMKSQTPKVRHDRGSR